MAEPGEKNISAFIDPEVSEAFKDRCEKSSTFKRKAVEGAIRLWLSLPNEVHALLISNPDVDVQSIYESLGNRLREALHNALLLEKQLPKNPVDIDPKGMKSPE